MSIANLFSPNDYTIYSKSSNTSGTINADRVNAPVIGTATAIPMQIGNTSTGLTVASAGSIVIDRAAPLTPADTLFLGNTNMGGISVGRIGGTITLNTGLTFPNTAGQGLIWFEVMTPISATCGGAIPATPNFMLLYATRINNDVTLRWRPASAVINATAATTLNLLQVLPVNFRPIGLVTAPAIVTGLNNWVYPAIITITTAGAMVFAFQEPTHNLNTTTWAVTEPCNVLDGSITYGIM